MVKHFKTKTKQKFVGYLFFKITRLLLILEHTKSDLKSAYDISFEVDLKCYLNLNIPGFA